MPRQNVLEGIRIVDCSRAYSGPFGSQLLADLGAEVIKIEVPGVGDFSRAMTPQVAPGQSYTILSLNRNKKSVALNVNTDLGRQAFHDLARVSDVVYANLRYDALARMGADYATLHQVNPRIILCNITGWGDSGPYAGLPSFDDNLLALSGISSLCSTDAEGRPTRAPIALADLSGGIFSTNGILAALYQRERTGAGCEVKMSILDCCLSLLGAYFQSYFITGQLPKPAGTRHPIGGISGAFKTRDGLIALSPCWPKITKVIHREDLLTHERYDTVEKRQRNNNELCDVIEQELMKQDTAYWLEVMRKEDVPVSPMNTLDKALLDPQVIHNRAVVEMLHPVYGPVKGIECPIKLEGAQASPHCAPPMLGEDTVGVLRDLLGYSESQIAALKREEDLADEKVKRRIKPQF